VTTTDHHHCTVHFQRWLAAGLTGCRFATTMAGIGKGAFLVFWTVLEDDEKADFDAIEGFLDAGAASTPETPPRSTIVVFPRVRSPRQVGRLLGRLRARPRWSCEPDGRSRDGDTREFLSLKWSTTTGLVSHAMGFAPFGTMPVSRRAPYVAIGIWGGGFENPFWPQKKRHSISFADARHPIENAEKHERMWKGSETDTAALLGDPTDDVKAMRRVAFCLPAGTGFGGVDSQPPSARR
jgi:hypothetical protein